MVRSARLQNLITNATPCQFRSATSTSSRYGSRRASPAETRTILCATRSLRSLTAGRPHRHRRTRHQAHSFQSERAPDAARSADLASRRTHATLVLNASNRPLGAVSCKGTSVSSGLPVRDSAARGAGSPENVEHMAWVEATTYCPRMERVEFRALFEAAAGLCLAVLPDEPRYTIVAVSDAYVRARNIARDGLVGRGLAEALAAYPAEDLAASLQRVVRRAPIR